MSNQTAPTLRDSRPSWDYNPARARELSQSQRRARKLVLEIFGACVIAKAINADPRAVLALAQEDEHDKRVSDRTLMDANAALAMLNLD